MGAQAVPLQSRKHQFDHEAIWEAAIGLFAEKGFEQATVDELAQAAGISRRTFFRYFASKNDLLAQSVVAYGDELARAIRACPREWPLLRVMEEVALEVGREIAARPRVRQVIRIAESSPAARAALLSTQSAAEDRVAAAFAGRLRKRASDPLRPRLLAATLFAILNVATQTWGESEDRQMHTLIREAFATLTQLAD